MGESSLFQTLKVYEITKNFPKEEVWSLTNQLRRAVFSIPANIAEGCGKNSQSDLAHLSKYCFRIFQ